MESPERPKKSQWRDKGNDNRSCVSRDQMKRLIRSHTCFCGGDGRPGNTTTRTPRWKGREAGGGGAGGLCISIHVSGLIMCDAEAGSTVRGRRLLWWCCLWGVDFFFFFFAFAVFLSSVHCNSRHVRSVTPWLHFMLINDESRARILLKRQMWALNRSDEELAIPASNYALFLKQMHFMLFFFCSYRPLKSLQMLQMEKKCGPPSSG